VGLRRTGLPPEPCGQAAGHQRRVVADAEEEGRPAGAQEVDAGEVRRPPSSPAGARRAHALLARAQPLADASDLAAHLQVRVLAGMVRAATGVEEQLALVAEAERLLVRSRACEPCSIGFCVASAVVCAGRARSPGRAGA
jgi:hypothetical protein